MSNEKRGGSNEIRTHTRQILSLFSLPVGVPSQMPDISIRQEKGVLE